MSTRRLMRAFCTVLLVNVLITACASKQAATGDADRRFEEMMNGVTLVGHSTRSDRPGLSGEERYVIDKVSKLSGDTWLFHARLQYGSLNLPVPVPVVIKWAGDTPVITLTDVGIPGLGTYSARVLLYRNQYAGTWSAKDHSGQIFGRIVRTQPAQ